MTEFLRLLAEEEKSSALLAVCVSLRSGAPDIRVFNMDTASFGVVPGTPFAYWVSDQVRNTFKKFEPFEGNGRVVRQGLATADDFRFVRAWWEVSANSDKWPGFAKGGKFSPFYADVYLVVNWGADGAEIKNNLNERGGVRSNVWMLSDTAAKYFRKPGLTWPSRARKFAPQALASNCLFSQRGYLAYFPDGDQIVSLALFNSAAFDYIFKITLGRFGYPEFLVGILKKMPLAVPDPSAAQRLEHLARTGWSNKRALDTIEETSHAFYLPSALRARLGDYDPSVIEAKLDEIQTEIDEIAFDLYGFNNKDRVAAIGSADEVSDVAAEDTDDGEDEDAAEAINQTDGLASWGVGVAFGRFDWRLATGEREVPSEPDPFDPLPAKSPGMLPDSAAPFHVHSGILVDDQGHPHDLPRLIEEVLARVQADVPGDARRWLQRDFFPLHLKQYSKSRRKAPIYWPLSTTSGSYTLWLYYPRLTSQTLYSAVNDFVEPKLRQVSRDAATLREKGAVRSRDDEKAFEALQALELELIELRDTLLQIAPTYRPNHDDGVQITAAPLWQLFRHKPWQKILKDTWAKLEKGDYDWAHVAMAYWPDRVREKCETDKSLAIAHGLENLYVEPEAQPKKARKKRGDA
ncbi:type II restriction enzyme, methylase subunit [Devosia soli]|uniref:Type II restriction enzyme, methylase subunit n=1 Tax=Devosia soli TaxID=361041 RepID=A0A0F5LBS0_9HYPH|nr:hypothetical protein [Devosia soli]KKB79730.1 type II restriction enzyme, methylase subunit [Devosia soli]